MSNLAYTDQNCMKVTGVDNEFGFIKNETYFGDSEFNQDIRQDPKENFKSSSQKNNFDYDDTAEKIKTFEYDDEQPRYENQSFTGKVETYFKPDLTNTEQSFPAQYSTSKSLLTTPSVLHQQESLELIERLRKNFGEFTAAMKQKQPPRNLGINSNRNLRKDKKPGVLTGVGETLKMLRNGGKIEGPPKPRIILDAHGHPIRPIDKLPACNIAEVQQRVILSDQQDGFDLPLLPNIPTDVQVVRRMIRQKMIRCKKCKTRFIEKNIYERHLRDYHPAEYDEFIKEQEEEVELQRLEEIEANRIEELQTGGFIPPESEIDQMDEFPPDTIPLPGENNGGVAPTFDIYGRIKQLKRPYKKKISPQCPFCDKRFRNEFSLKKHFSKKHEEMLEFQQCLKCFKCVENDEELEDHDCELTYVCFECLPHRNLSTDQRLLNHRRKFHRGANSGFRCSFCNLKFLTPRKLRKHKKMSHVFTKTYQCHFCEEIFISEVGVMTHERMHTGIIKFECKVCDYRANRFNQMEEHTKNEHGYVCNICQEKITEYGELKHHTLEEHGGYLATEQITGHVECPRLWILYKGE